MKRDSHGLYYSIVKALNRHLNSCSFGPGGSLNSKAPQFGWVRVHSILKPRPLPHSGIYDARGRVRWLCH
jgi:hypothetical protein